MSSAHGDPGLQELISRIIGIRKRDHSVGPPLAYECITILWCIFVRVTENMYGFSLGGNGRSLCVPPELPSDPSYAPGRYAYYPSLKDRS